MSNEGANSVLALTVDGETVVMTAKGNCSTATIALTAEDALMLAVSLRRQQRFMKESFERLTHDFETLFLVGRARSLVLTKLEEAYMWVGKAIRDDQADRESKSTGSTKMGGQT